MSLIETPTCVTWPTSPVHSQGADFEASPTSTRAALANAALAAAPLPPLPDEVPDVCVCVRVCVHVCVCACVAFSVHGLVRKCVRVSLVR